MSESIIVEDNDNFSSIKKSPTSSPTVSPTSKFSPMNRSPRGESSVKNIIGKITSIKVSKPSIKNISPRQNDDEIFYFSDEE